MADSRSLVKGEGLRIATWARPPRLTRGATGVSLWAAPGRGKTACRKLLCFGCLGDGWGSLNVSPRIMLESSIVGYALSDTSWRILPCCSLGQERTCRAGYEVVKVYRPGKPVIKEQNPGGCFPRFPDLPALISESSFQENAPVHR